MSAKPDCKRSFSASDAVSLGSLGTGDLQRRRKDRLAGSRFEFLGRERLDVEFGGFLEICQRFLESIALRVTAFQFGAVGKIAVLVLLNDRAKFKVHDGNLG